MWEEMQRFCVLNVVLREENTNIKTLKNKSRVKPFCDVELNFFRTKGLKNTSNLH